MDRTASRRAYYAERNMGWVFDDPYDPRWWRGSKYREALVRFRPERFGPRALDLGCGLGQAAWRLAERFEQVVALDLSEDAIAFAREHYRRHNLRFVHADLRDYTPERPFDVIFCMDVIEHLEPEAGRALVRRLGQLLRAGGALVAHVPTARTWAGERKRLRYQRKRAQPGETVLDHTGDPTHRATFSPASFRALLADGGLRIEHTWRKMHAWRPVRALARAVLSLPFVPERVQDAATYSYTVLAVREAGGA